VETSTTTHPITGEVTKVFSEQPVDLTGFSFTAQISDSFDSPTFTENMSVEALTYSGGIISVSLSKEQTTSLAARAVLSLTGVPSERVGRLGYYDIVATSPSGDSTRVVMGEIFLSKGVSVDSSPTSTIENAVPMSSLAPLTQNIELAVSSTDTRYFVSVRYYQNGIQVIPTAGSVAIFRRPPAGSFESTAFGTLQATDGTTELQVDLSSDRLRAVPTGVVGADAYQLVVIGE
jgi:hypothetical protein